MKPGRRRSQWKPAGAIDAGAARAGGLGEEHVHRRQKQPVGLPRRPDATKPEIKAAVELMFRKVEGGRSVQVANVQGKEKRFGAAGGPAQSLEEGVCAPESRPGNQFCRRGGDQVMALVKVKPTSPGQGGGQGGQSRPAQGPAVRAHLVERKNRKAGRNMHGEITMRHQGGGHKQHYRMVDFTRDKDGITAKVERLEYDPNRSAILALLCYADGERRYIIAPEGRRGGCSSYRGRKPDQAGNTLPLRNIPVGTTIHCVEMLPGKGAQLARAAGAAVQLLAREGEYAQLRLRSGEIRKVHVDCRATIGEVGNEEHSLESIGKAGAHALARHAADGARRGDEPGRPPAWRRRGQDGGGARPGVAVGQLTKGYKTRKNKRTDAMIVRRRTQGGLEADHGTFDQEGPVRRSSPGEEGGDGREDQRQASDQDLVAALDHPARFRRAHHRGAQRQAAHPGLRDREHGRPQARRVLADPHVQGPFRPRPRRKSAAPAAPRKAGGAATKGRPRMNTTASCAACACRPRRAGSWRTSSAGSRSSRRSTSSAFTPKKGAVIIRKVLESAIANAEHNDGADIDELQGDAHLVERGTC